MKPEAKLYLVAILLTALTAACWAEEPPQRYEGVTGFSDYYYLKPDPNKVPEILEEFLESDFYTDEFIYNEHSQNIAAYFFARVAMGEPNLIANYK